MRLKAFGLLLPPTGIYIYVHIYKHIYIYVAVAFHVHKMFVMARKEHK